MARSGGSRWNCTQDSECSETPVQANIILMNTSAQPVRAEFDFPTTMPSASKRAIISPATIEPFDEEAAWKQVQARDREARFFYAVTTTGVFCHPWCASRRPLRANARFFLTTQAAQAAGFRPCKKCKPTAVENAVSAGRPVDKVRSHIERNLDRAVKLEELGRIAGMSPFTVQRLFKSEMGVSPLVAIAVSAAFGVITVLLVRLAVRARQRKARLGADALIGSRATAMEPLSPVGHILVEGEIWQAVASQPQPAGAPLMVVGKDHMVLRVEPLGANEPVHTAV